MGRTLGVLAVGRYMSEAWFGRQPARDPPGYRRARNGPARPPAGPAPSVRHGQPEPERQGPSEPNRPAGMALIVTGTVLLLAVSMSPPFLNVKLLGLIMIVVDALQRVSSWLWRNRQVGNGPTRLRAGPAPLPCRGQSEPGGQARPELTRPTGIALIVTGAVLLLAVSISLPFLNVKLLGLIMIVAGLVKVGALQRVSSWLWRNRRVVMAARVPLDTLLEANAPAPPRPSNASRRRGRARGGEATEGVLVLGSRVPLPSRPDKIRRVYAPSGPVPHGHRHWALQGTIIAVLLVGIAAALWLAATWPGAHYMVYVAWMLPIAELALLVLGQAHFRLWFREAPPARFSEMIIQITTAGHEPARVTEIIKQIRGYTLTMNYEIWVVTEPGYPTEYQLADRVLVVPLGFEAKSQKKARALEYSRRIRHKLGLERGDVKILFNDDDVTLTEAYINRAFAADYDVCEGVITPRTRYADWPPWHFLVSHADDVRTHSCLVYCSVFQGMLRRPLHVHGEGLVVTGEAEGLVTWDWPVTASEDLVFGQRAAGLGLEWGWFHEYAEVTSPWGLRDYLTQRRRWLWGDIHAITHRAVISFPAAVLVAGKYVIGMTALLCSAVGWYLRLTGKIQATAGIFDYAKLSVLAWVAVFFACGWIGASSAQEGRGDDSRLLAGVVAVVMVPVSLLLTLAAVLVPLAQGDPRTFTVIRKTKGAQ
jgi:hypothetical protein